VLQAEIAADLFPLADQLALSVKTIRTHKSRLMEKMRLGTQADS
jgi:DNA-binding CsgD family transcriptional regulator